MPDRQPAPGVYGPNPSCCAPTTPPDANAYKAHLRAKTPPCPQASRDSAAYRLARKHANEETR